MLMDKQIYFQEYFTIDLKSQKTKKNLEKIEWAYLSYIKR